MNGTNNLIIIELIKSLNKIIIFLIKIYRYYLGLFINFILFVLLLNFFRLLHHFPLFYNFFFHRNYSNLYQLF